MAFLPPSQPFDWTFRRVVWETLVFVFVAFCFWLLYRFNQVVFVLFIAIVIGTVIRPVVTWLQRRRIPQFAAVVLVYLFLLVFLIGFGFLLFPLIIEQGTKIVAVVPDYYRSFRDWMGNSPNHLIAVFNEALPTELSGLVPVWQTGQMMLLDSAQEVLGYVVSAANGIFLGISILLLALHWTLDGPRIIQSLLQLVPKDKRESTNELITAMEAKVGFFIAGQGVLCLMIGSMALVVYLFIGLPNALVLALVAGLMEAVPMIGPLLGAIPAGLIALSISPEKLVWVILASVAIQLIENNLLVPRVMRKAVGVNPFVSLLAISAFSSFFGVAGALMAIPMAAIIQLLLNRYIFHPGTMEAEVSDGRDYTSRLRYEAQDLVQDLRKQARLNKEGSDHSIAQIDEVMDEIESITTDLDTLLAQVPPSGAL